MHSISNIMLCFTSLSKVYAYKHEMATMLTSQFHSICCIHTSHVFVFVSIEGNCDKAIVSKRDKNIATFHAVLFDRGICAQYLSID